MTHVDLTVLDNLLTDDVYAQLKACPPEARLAKAVEIAKSPHWGAWIKTALDVQEYADKTFVENVALATKPRN